MNMVMIKPLEKPFKIKLEQYKCECCKKNLYINSEDKLGDFVHCPFCKAEAKNIRIFDIEIKGIGEY